VSVRIFPEIAAFLAEVDAEREIIPTERKTALDRLAVFIDDRRSHGKTAKLIFICTHNSRRSHLAQIWAQTTAHYFGIEGIETYSGGTEATAFNPRAMAVLQRTGFRVETVTPGDNPLVRIRYSTEADPMDCFSKTYDQPPNPRTDFCAIMTCSDADRHCPIVFGAADRIVIRYDDPKEFDGTFEEEARYDERCRQIAREMVWALGRVR
jgi:arsenate reductase